MIRNFLAVLLISASTVGLGVSETALGYHFRISQVLEQTEDEGSGCEPERGEINCETQSDKEDLVIVQSHVDEGDGNEPRRNGDTDPRPSEKETRNS